MNTLMNIAESITSLYESILNDIETTIESAEYFNDLSYKFNWIAGQCTYVETRAIKGGVKKNLEEIIGKKQKDIDYYIGPIVDRIYKYGLDIKKLFRKASYKSSKLIWLAAIILETKFDEPVETLNSWEISKGIETHINKTLNNLCLDDDKKFSSQALYNSHIDRFEVFINVQSKSNPKYPAPALIILRFDASVHWLKNRKRGV